MYNSDDRLCYKKARRGWPTLWWLADFRRTYVRKTDFRIAVNAPKSFLHFFIISCLNCTKFKLRQPANSARVSTEMWRQKILQNRNEETRGRKCRSRVFWPSFQTSSVCERYSARTTNVAKRYKLSLHTSCYDTFIVFYRRVRSTQLNSCKITTLPLNGEIR